MPKRYFTILHLRTGNIKTGQRYGKLSMRLSEMFNIDAWRVRVEALYYGNTFCWKHPFKDALAPLQEARQIALASGDVEYAMANANLICLLELDLLPIPQLIDKILEYQDSMKSYGQNFGLGFLHPSLYVIVKCSGRISHDFPALRQAAVGVFGEEYVNNAALFVQWAHFARMTVHFIFDEYDEAAHCSQFCSFILEHSIGSADTTMPCLIACLLAIQRLRQNQWNARLIWDVMKRIRQLRCWADCCPSNFLGKLSLAEAEWASLRGSKKKLAHRKYVTAISLFNESGFYQQTALANELAGKHFARIGEGELARRFLKKAIDKYFEWGGHAKAEKLASSMKSLCGS